MEVKTASVHTYTDSMDSISKHLLKC